jgi:cell wall-associated protease
MKHTTTLVMAMLALCFTVQSKATVMAVIDSGTDFSHPDLANVKWTNPIDIDDAVDNDNNGYIDDINGWNFADGNNKLYDKSFLGTFSPDTYEYFAVQTRLLKGTGTAADLAWIRAKQADADFIGGLETFANFVHGSHVAGIMTKDSPNSQLMALKIMPTKRPLAAGSSTGTPPAPPAACGTISGFKDTLIKTGLKALAGQQGKAMVPFGQYVNNEKARVANCSFGISTAAATGTIAPLLTSILKCTPSKDQLTAYATIMVNAVVESQKTLVTSAPNTLFVIAAGNDGSDNDLYPASPANIKADNTIAVAATLDYQKIASFSNYGKTMVEVAAPGVGIESSIPGNMHLTVSGTSQASPFIANIAGQILDQNPALTLKDVKKIIMGTVDLKPWLAGKVVSQGVANPGRAIMAAKMSKTSGVDNAISSARLQVMDVVSKRAISKNSIVGDDYEGYVMPLPTLFN